MTSPNSPANDPFEEELRRLLKAEADEVPTSPEALNLIRERTERRGGPAWFGVPWLRPAVAVAGAALIAGSVIVSTPQVRDHVLEIVPAGADRQGTPAEQEEGGGVAPPSPSPDATHGTPESDVEEPDQDPPSPAVPETDDEEETSPSQEGMGTASECRPGEQRERTSPSPSTGEQDRESASESECDPTDEPSDGGDGDRGEDDGDTGDGGDGGEDSTGGGDDTGVPGEGGDGNDGSAPTDGANGR